MMLSPPVSDSMEAVSRFYIAPRDMRQVGKGQIYPWTARGGEDVPDAKEEEKKNKTTVISSTDTD